MTYSELLMKATPEQRTEVRARVEKIIGTKDEAKASAYNTTERIQRATAYDRAFEKLAKVFFEKGAKALALNFVVEGSRAVGVTANGKQWELLMNSGYALRSKYCGRLFIEGEGTIFTSGRLDKVFEYILNA